MAEKDIAEKMLFDFPDVVADVMNVLLFDGKQVVKEKDIIPTDAKSQYKIENELHEEERDNLMAWKRKGRSGHTSEQNIRQIRRSMKQSGYSGMTAHCIRVSSQRNMNRTDTEESRIRILFIRTSVRC